MIIKRNTLCKCFFSTSSMLGLAGKLCLSYSYIAGIKHPNRRQHAGGKWSVYSSSFFQVTIITEGSQNRNPRQEPGLRNWCRGLGRVLLTGLVFMTCSVCFLTLLRTMGGTTMGWAHHINHQSRKYVTSLPVGQSAGGIFSIEISLLKMTLACVRLI